MAQQRLPDRSTPLTAYGRTPVAIVRDPAARLRDLAVVGVTERTRTAQVIVVDLQAAGYVTSERIGRRNRYTVDLVHLERPFRHRAQNGLQVGPLLAPLASAESPLHQHAGTPGAGEDAAAAPPVTAPEGGEHG